MVPEWSHPRVDSSAKVRPFFSTGMHLYTMYGVSTFQFKRDHSCDARLFVQTPCCGKRSVFTCAAPNSNGSHV